MSQVQLVTGNLLISAKQTILKQCFQLKQHYEISPLTFLIPFQYIFLLIKVIQPGSLVEY